MATSVEGNLPLQRFIQLLADLNHQTVSVIQTGDTKILAEMNKTVEEMYAIQHEGKEEAYTAIEEDAQIIYKNFNAVVTMMNSNERATGDTITSAAVKKFLHNIFDANVRIIQAYGLA